MAIREIRQEGDDILHKISRPVETIDNRIKELIKDMIDTLHKYDGVGLAAVQVGVLKQVIVIDTAEDGVPLYVLINPKILETKGIQEVEEGCLSFPNKFAKMLRPEKIKIEALNENGKRIEVRGQGLLAQAISHEIDHLNGQVFIDKIIPGTLEIIKQK